MTGGGGAGEARHPPRRVKRAWRILRTLVRYRLDQIVALALPATWAARCAAWLPRAKGDPATRTRQALEALGPVFVKFGQLLSTRRDLLPLAFADELAKLQDRVPPFPASVAFRELEKSLGEAPDQAFASIEAEPLASASLAQVHAATLHTGEAVVVKVLRPAIEATIEADLALLASIAASLCKRFEDARRLRLTEVVSDYATTLRGELDLLLEARNTVQLRRNFEGSALLYVPRVWPEFSRPNVLVMERVDALPISDVAALRAAGTDMARLAEVGVETFFTQVFEHNFFHADMHPGNIFVDVSDPASPSYIAVDCAIIGSLTPTDQRYIARNLLAFFNQDYRAVATLHLQSGWVPATTDIDHFEAVIRELCEPLFERPLHEISFGEFLVALFQAARQFDMQIQPQLVLLQKTLINIEGLGRQLYPELDLWTTAKPFMERWMRERYGVAALIARVGTGLVDNLPRLPELAVTAFERLEGYDRTVREQAQAIDALARAVATLNRRGRGSRRVGIALLVVGVALFVGQSLGAPGDVLPMATAVATTLFGGLLLGRG